MRKLSLLLPALSLSIFISAQAPQALNYQAVARNSMGQIVPSQPIGVRFTISDATGNTVFYQETHNTTTNNFGLFTLAIGKGTAVSGGMSPIDWSNGDKYLKVEIAPQGGSNYTMQGSTQLLSVPYALYSEKTKLVAGTGISITNGNTISGNYQAGNAIMITGNTISGNYQAGNAIMITGNTISGNYQAGNAIMITGNAISANYQAGPGITITGNTISSASGLWVADAAGIHNTNATGHVGIGGSSHANQTLTVYKMEGTVDGNPTARFVSNDTWQTSLNIDNTTSDKAFSIVAGGTGNTQTTYGVGSGNFGIVNGKISTSVNTIPFIITSDDKVGISSRIGGSNNLPHSRLHVRDGDVYIDEIGSGVIMKSPNGQCWRMTVSNTGTPVFTAISCP